MIQVCTPLITGNEKKYLVDCIEKNEISSGGRYLEAFENAFSAYCGVHFGVGTTSGTTALHLAVAALGIGPGDEVIIPDFTIAACAFAVIYCGAKPIFVDVEPDTWNLNPALIEKKITKRTKAIMPVHIYGHPCDMDSIIALAKKYKLMVIEDAAEAHGATYKGKVAGGIGHVGIFSFYANKIITSGEGGMVITNNPRIAERARLLRNLAFLKKKRFFHKEIGFNFRMTNLQAALGLAQFEKINEFIERRRNNASKYQTLLKDVRGLTLPIERPETKNVYWMYGVLVDKNFGMNRDTLMTKLYESGIETRTFFIPMHRQPIFKKMGLCPKEKFPVTERISQTGFYLPSSSGLTESEIRTVCHAIKKIKGHA